MKVKNMHNCTCIAKTRRTPPQDLRKAGLNLLDLNKFEHDFLILSQEDPQQEQEQEQEQL